VINICDREADITEFLYSAFSEKSSFLIRSHFNRRVKAVSSRHETVERKLWDHMSHQKTKGIIEVDLPHISKTKDRHKREKRTIQLGIRFSHIELNPSKKYDEKIPHRIGVIYAKEKDPPKGKKAVEWMLLTNHQINTIEDALEKINWYKQRWHIENYHRVLKSGCSVEECQLETVDRLRKYLTLMSIIAWRLYWMNRISRISPDISCNCFLEEDEWKALCCLTHQTPHPPKEPPSAYQAVRWIAKLGGFLGRKGDGEPGMITLWRGWLELMAGVKMWLVLNGKTCG
jgi:hypothetical protein